MTKINKYLKVSTLASLTSLLFLVNLLEVQSQSSLKPLNSNILARRSDGKLVLYQDTNGDGVIDAGNAQNIVDSGFGQFQDLTYIGNGNILARRSDGKLVLYQDTNGDGVIDAGNAQNVVDSGWNIYQDLTYIGNGNILARRSDGKLVLYQDTNGDGVIDAGNAQNVVDSGWNIYQDLTYIGNGNILARRSDGKLVLYQDTKGDGVIDAGNAQNVVDSGWNIYQDLTYIGDGGTGDIARKDTDTNTIAPSSVITPVTLPTSAINGSSTWTIDARGRVSGSITYTVGSGFGSKKYSSGVVVEFLDGSTYYAETTKTVGRPSSGSTKGTHTVSTSSIPLNQVNQIRRIFVNYQVDRGLDTIGEWKDLVVDALVEADEDYQKLKELGLVKDAAAAAAGS